ncbi:MAG: TolC family protein [Vicingaceae bacterium]
MKKIIFSLLFILPLCFLQAQEALTLEAVIQQAKAKSIRSKQIENRYQNSYWRNFAFRRQFLPSLNFNGTLPEIQRSISSVTQNDGTEIFVNRNVLSNRANLGLNQAVPFTGGNLFVRTGLDNIQLSGNTNSTTYLSRPLEVGYSQNVFGFNQFKWDRKIEPLLFNEADLLKTEEIEALSIEAVNRYFDLLRDQLALENAKNNYANNDTIYKIGKGRYGYGKISENELLQLELSLLNSEMALDQRRLNLELSRQKLATFLGYPSQQDIELKIDTIIPEYIVSFEEALSYAKQLNSLQVQQKRRAYEAEMNVARVKSNNRFNFNLNATFGLSQTAETIEGAYENPQNQEYVSLGVNIPIIQWGAGRGRIKQAQANAELVRSTIEQEAIDFEQDIYEKVATYNLNRKQLLISKRAREVAEKRFEVTKQRYLLGKILITDLQIAQTEKDNALLSYMNAFRVFWQSYYDLRRITHYDFEKQAVIGASE